MTAELELGDMPEKPKRQRVARPRPPSDHSPPVEAQSAGGEAGVASPPQIWEPSNAPTMMLRTIAELAANPATNIENTKALYEMYQGMVAEQAKREYAAAMTLVQAEIQPVVRATENTATRSFYAKLEAVDAAIRPIYLKHGFSVSRNTVPPIVPGNIRIEVTVTHGAHSERFGREAPPDTVGPKGTPTKTPLQGGASTDTFLTRYATCGAFNVIFRDRDLPDDDGNGGVCSEEQVAHLRSLIATVINLDPARAQEEAKLCKYLEVEVLDGLPGYKYAKGLNAITGVLDKLSKLRPQEAPVA